jgi:hypothetical protein
MRWLVLGCAVAALVAAGSSGARAVPVRDETHSCAVEDKGGVPVAYLKAYANYRFRNNGHTFSFPPLAGLSDFHSNSLALVAAVQHGYGHAPSPLCVTARSIPLARGSLPLLGVYKNGSPGLGGGTGGNGAECWVGAHITVRERIRVNSKDVPVSGQIAVRSGAKLKPLAYIVWTPDRVTVYASGSCTV